MPADSMRFVLRTPADAIAKDSRFPLESQPLCCFPTPFDAPHEVGAATPRCFRNTKTPEVRSRQWTSEKAARKTGHLGRPQSSSLARSFGRPPYEVSAIRTGFHTN